MSNNKDFKVKNGILPTSYQEGLGTVVSAVEGYSLGAASYDSKSFSTSQDTNEYGIAFKSDGTKFYMVGDTGDSVYQYSMSTAWDISTASYDSVSFSVASQDGSPRDIAFNTSGTKMYILAADNKSVFQYTLSTAWDISTASYDSVSFSINSQDTSPSGLRFKTDGTKMYVIGYSSDSVHQYTLSTAFDLSTASYDSVSFSVASQNTTPFSVAFNSSGTSMYMLGGNTFFQYTLSTAWDISTASYDSVSFDFSSQDVSCRDAVFKDDGSKVYLLGEQEGKVFQYSTIQTTNTLDLSTGSVFDLTPTSDAQVTLSNPAASGTVSQATLLLGSEDAAGVASAFSTTLYTGNGGTQTITNGIDLAGEGGLVWTKQRDGTRNHRLVDTDRGATFSIASTSSSAQAAQASGLTAFNSDGYSLGSDTDYNTSASTFASWTFKKQAKFFDIVRYTGTGSAQTISHNLGGEVGMIIVKQTSSVRDWIVFHRSLGKQGWLELNETDAARTGSTTAWNDTDPTSTTFSVNGNARNNFAAQNYVAYLFAHDTDASSLIKCGSYTGTDGAHDITLGFEPQWILFKRSNSAASWLILDNVRGLPISGGVNQASLSPNENTAEYTNTNYGVAVNSTGFSLSGSSPFTNDLNDTYIYMAIRNPYIPTITYDPTLEWPNGTAPTAPAIGETDVITFNTSDGGTTYSAVQAIDGAK